MTRHDCLTMGCIALLLTAVPAGAANEGPRAAQKTSAATAAGAQASPELVGALSKELGSTPEQAAGAAGALFGVAKTRLKANEFSQVSNAVPGMGALLKAAPATGGTGAVGTAGALSALSGSAAGLAGAASAFSKLGLSPAMVSKAVPVLTSFVSKSGGADVAKLLAGALK